MKVAVADTYAVVVVIAAAGFGHVHGHGRGEEEWWGGVFHFAFRCFAFTFCFASLLVDKKCDRKEFNMKVENKVQLMRKI